MSDKYPKIPISLLIILFNISLGNIFQCSPTLGLNTTGNTIMVNLNRGNPTLDNLNLGNLAVGNPTLGNPSLCNPTYLVILLPGLF